RIDSLFQQQTSVYGPEFTEAFHELKRGLNSGAIRSAEPADGDSPSGWKVNTWVKKGILLGFRIGTVERMPVAGELPFFDKHTYPLKPMSVQTGVRVVPGGSSVRDGVYLGKGVVC